MQYKVVSLPLSVPIVGLDGLRQTSFKAESTGAKGAESSLSFTSPYGPHLLRASLSAAMAAHALKGFGTLFKKAIDGRGTDEYVQVFEKMVQEYPDIEIRVVQGEGEKDNSVGLFSGKVFRNPHAEKINTVLQIIIDPIDGTSPTAGGTPLKGAPLGTSDNLVIFSQDPMPSFPDTVSAWLVATSMHVPAFGLSVADPIDVTVHKTAVAVLTERFGGRGPLDSEIHAFIRDDLRVVLMNRDFQNGLIVSGLNKAGMELPCTIGPDGKLVLTDENWTTHEKLDNKNYRHVSGKVSLIGDGNIAAPLMRSEGQPVHLVFGNSGSVESFQLMPFAGEAQSVFISKTLRAKRPVDELVRAVVVASNLPTAAQKRAVFEGLFSADEKADFYRTSGSSDDDIARVMTVFKKEDLTAPYMGIISFITDPKGPDVFPVPGVSGVKVVSENDGLSITVSAIVGDSDGHLLTIEEKFAMEARLVEAYRGLSEASSNKAAHEYVSLGLERAAVFARYGCYRDAELTLVDVEAGIDRFNKIYEADRHYWMGYASQVKFLREKSAIIYKLEDLRDSKNVGALLEAKDQIDKIIRAFKPEEWQRGELTYFIDEIDARIAKLKK